MGYDIERFTDTVSDSFLCSVCSGVLEAPLETLCGKLFCSKCILSWMFKHQRCPLASCTKCPGITVENLKPISKTFKDTLLSYQLRCDHQSRGCPVIIPLRQVLEHAKQCQFRPVRCRNRSCGIIVDFKSLDRHEKETCSYRPMGLCNLGCGRELTYKQSAGSHNCIETLKNHISTLDMTITTLNQDKKRLISKFSKQEKCLLSQITRLQSELETQALSFEQRLADYRKQINYLCNRQQFLCSLLKTEEQLIKITLERTGPSLGFNIRGGDMRDTNEGIWVSHVSETGSAALVGLATDDQIVKVNKIDLSQATHDDAVEIFKTTPSPISIEVIRRTNYSKNSFKESTNTCKPPFSL